MLDVITESAKKKQKKLNKSWILWKLKACDKGGKVGASVSYEHISSLKFRESDSIIFVEDCFIVCDKLLLLLL